MPRSTGILRVERKSGAVKWRTRWVDAAGTRRSELYASEAAARAGLRRRQVEADDMRSGRTTAPSAGAGITLAAYGKTWVARRQGRVRSADAEDTRLAHLLAHIGTLTLAEVRPRHIRDAVLALRAQGKLAPRTIRHAYGALRGLFRSAVTDELVPANPCDLERGVLPPNIDKDPGWRATAVFTRDELERLISDERIPLDRRVLYALFGLAGLRLGEAAGLRWSHYDATCEPLGRLFVNQSYGRPGTKSGVAREVPAHPTLAKILAAWKLGGWEAHYGRQPAADDLIVPTRRDKMRNMRNRKDATTARERDFEALGIRHRRGHDLRRTFVSLTQADGALPHILERVTHGPRGDILNQYTTYPWATLCGEVAKLRVVVHALAPVMRLAG